MNQSLGLARTEQVVNLVKGNLPDADAVPMCDIIGNGSGTCACSVFGPA